MAIEALERYPQKEPQREANDYPLLPENGRYFTYRRDVVMKGFDLLLDHAKTRGFTIRDIRIISGGDTTSKKLSEISKTAKDFVAKVDTSPQSFTVAELALILNRSRAAIRDYLKSSRTSKSA